MVPLWKRNLWLCCLACFIISIGMSQLAPILPLYLHEMGMTGEDEIAKWSGLIFGANFVTLAIASPIWGRLSDKYGRKPMVLRASLWLGIIMFGMGMAASPWHLLVLRLLQGAMSGFLAAAVPLVAQEAPKEQSAWALGMFFTCQVSGGLLGPLFGGLLTELYNCRQTFFVMSAFCFLGFAALWFVHETFRPKKEEASAAISWSSIPRARLLVGIFVTTLLLHFSLSTIHPIVTVYIRRLVPESEHVALIAGAVFSATGLASAIAASPLGRLADRIGSRRVLLGSLIMSSLCFLPQAYVRTPLELGILRFLAGLAAAGLMPSSNALIRQAAPEAMMGRIYGINQSFQFVGMFSGAVAGGQLAASIGIAGVFLVPGVLLLLNAVWFWSMSRET